MGVRVTNVTYLCRFGHFIFFLLKVILFWKLTPIPTLSPWNGNWQIWFFCQIWIFLAKMGASHITLCRWSLQCPLKSIRPLESTLISVGKKSKMFICVYLCLYKAPFMSPKGLCKVPLYGGFIETLPHICRKKDWNMHICVYICVWNPQGLSKPPLYRALTKPLWALHSPSVLRLH